MGDVYEIEYMNGSKEEINSDFVCKYSLSKSEFVGDGHEIREGLFIDGNGYSEKDFIGALYEKKPILISRTRGNEIERIINTEQVKAINKI